MEDNYAVKDEEESLDVTPHTAPLAVIPTSTLLFLKTEGPNLTDGTDTENKAVSMASNECSSSRSSPTEASPANPEETLTTLDDVPETSSATAASRSDSLKCREIRLVDIPESSTSFSMTPSSNLCSPDLEKDFPAELTFKGVSVTLRNNDVWKEFYSCGTEMIITKPGRRMFPYCQYKISDLDPDMKYNLVLSIVPWGQHRYRWHMNKWEVHGPSGYTSNGLFRAYSHPDSPRKGSFWMMDFVSFDKLKLSNNQQNVEGHIVLNSMHRYIPNLHVIPVMETDKPSTEQPVLMGTESLTFTFPQTEFIGVTCYQNFKIIQLKISHNPFAKAFRDEERNSRCQKQSEDGKLERRTIAPTVILHQLQQNEDDVIDLSTEKNQATVSKLNVQEPKLVLKPFMANSAGKSEPYYRCSGGKQPLCDLKLVETQPLVEPKEEEMEFSVTADVQEDSNTTFFTSTPTSSSPYRKRGRKSSRGRGSSQERHWKTTAASSSFDQSPPLNDYFHPELDDVEGLLFASFTSREELDFHVRQMLPSASSYISMEEEPEEMEPEIDEETLNHLELNLEKDLKALKHRQVIHPVLQEVGLKLSSLHPSKPLDLRYLGVCLPLPPPDSSLPSVSSPADEGLPFISRNGKTSDITKIKGWKTKYAGSGDISSSKCEGSQKNLSAFCSNMLDEYLENEAFQISERAEAFSTTPESLVAYQLPEKSSSYIKTLDSALKHRNAASQLPKETPKSWPQSSKSRIYAPLVSLPLLLPKPATPTTSTSGTTNIESQKASTCFLGLGRGRGGRGRGRGRGILKSQFRLLQMEKFALNQGHSRTQLTPDRVSVALSAVMTKQTMYKKFSNIPWFETDKSDIPECGKDYCRLGCVCSSLQLQNREYFHCRRPECMLGCTCLKHKITKQTCEGESEEKGQPLYSMTNTHLADEPFSDSHPSKLWNYDIDEEDPEPLFTPEYLDFAVFSPAEPDSEPEVQVDDEEDVLLEENLESSLMCARVRGINSQPPPQVLSDPTTISTPPSNTDTHREGSTDNLEKNNTAPLAKKSERISEEFLFNDKEAKKQIQIHSKCQWNKDRGWVTKALCHHINNKPFSKRFYIGRYCIDPVAKIFMRKSSGTTITYKVRISKKSQSSDTDEDDSDYSNGELEEGQVDQSMMLWGVTPFLRGVTPAGRLTARRKPVGCKVQGLVEVNGKFYNHAKVMLGNIGSLHPANRLASYICGRLQIPDKFQKPHSQKLDPTHKPSDDGNLSIKAAGSVVPHVITARKTTDLKTPVQVLDPGLCGKGSDTGPPSSDGSSTSYSANSSVSNQIKILKCESLMPSQKEISDVSSQSRISELESSVSNQSKIPESESLGPSRKAISESMQSRAPFSPLSLTVSPTLRNPSFLEQSGTRSFRICPPSSQDQNPAGVSLPGGFYLIQLPKTDADKPSQPTEPSVGTKKTTSHNLPIERNSSVSQLAADWFGANAFDKIRSLFGNDGANPDSVSNPNRIEKMQLDEKDESKNNQEIKQEESNLDDLSEYASSSFSDDSGDSDEDNDYVEVENGEEMEITQWRKDTFEKLLQTRACNDSQLRKYRSKDQLDEKYFDKRRYIHTTLEKQRRDKQRDLFNQLMLVLQIEPPNSRLNVLNKAQQEIENLVEISKVLEKKKTMLIEMQSIYLKKLCILSGKSEFEIRNKLMEICKKLKVKEDRLKWKPDLVEHLRLRAALQKATSAKSSYYPSLLEEHGYATPSQDESFAIPAHTNIHKMRSLVEPPEDKPLTESFGKSSRAEPPPPPPPPPLPPLSPLPPLPQTETVAPSIQVKIEKEEADHPLDACQSLVKLVDKMKDAETSKLVKTPVSKTNSNIATVKPTSETSAPKEASMPAPSQPSQEASKKMPTKFVNLPLIRSKTGRIILPSCLRPMGDGFYTLMYLEPKSGGEVRSLASAQSSSMNTSTISEGNNPKADQPPSSEKGGELEGRSDSSVVESNVVKHPITGLLSHSTLPLIDTKVLGKSQEGGAEAGVRKTLAALRLAFNRKNRPPGSVDSEVQVVQKHKGKPAKILAKPANSDKKETRKLSDSAVRQLVTDQMLGKAGMETGEGEVETPSPSKRRCGRPKKKTEKQPPGRKASKANRDNSISFPRRMTEKLTSARSGERPMTRGALGKDFPSAKKRSWIDVEMELEPENDNQ